jgi:hypothetical protein
VPSLGFAAHSPEVFVVDGHAFQARTTLGQARDATRELTGRNRGACALNRREVINYFTLVPQISKESLLSKYPILRRRSRHSGHSRVGGHPASPSLGHYLLVERSRRSRSQAERCPRDSGLRVGGRSDGLEDGDGAVFPGPIALPSEYESSPWRGGSGPRGPVDRRSDTGAPPILAGVEPKFFGALSTVRKMRLGARPGVQSSGIRTIRYFVSAVFFSVFSGEPSPERRTSPDLSVSR